MTPEREDKFFRLMHDRLWLQDLAMCRRCRKRFPYGETSDEDGHLCEECFQKDKQDFEDYNSTIEQEWRTR